MRSARHWCKGAILLTVMVIPLVGSGCADGDDFDRQAAIERLVDSGEADGPQEAACFVDRVVADLGETAVDDSASLDLEQYRELTVIRLDCLGPAGLGSPARDGGDGPDRTVDTVVRNAPYTLGDDEDLDALWARCEAGIGAACDELFDEAPLGSDYERFAVSCGGRGAQLSCAVAYPGDVPVDVGAVLNGG